MNYSLSSVLQGMKSPYGMKNWGSYPIATDLDFSNCMDLVEHIKEQAGILPEQDIWNHEKTIKLVSSTKWRKFFYFAVWPAIIFFGIAAAIIMVLLLVCIWSGNSCASEPSTTLLTLAFMATSFATVGLLWIKTYLSRDRRQVEIMDYFASDLSVDQKRNIVDIIRKLKEQNHQLYVAGNYDVLRSLPSISWTAENWFLLFSENERHRFAIWLDGSYPVGRLLIRVSKRGAKKTGTVWDKVKLPNTKLLFSQKDRIIQAVKNSGELKLNPHQIVWREGLVVLNKNYDEYLNYLEKTLDSAARKAFLSKFTPIFAVLSKNYKHQINTIGKEKLDLHALGASGATKFLRGTNENIDRWIDTIMPR